MTGLAADRTAATGSPDDGMSELTDAELYLRGLLSGMDSSAFHVLVASLGGEHVSTAIAFDFAGDCGIHNVGTLEPARRRGLATALTAIHLHDARIRGCRTVSLQSTAVAERVYAAAGFRDLGRILEYVPSQR